jgi:hypothetical protein
MIFSRWLICLTAHYGKTTEPGLLEPTGAAIQVKPS